MKKGPGPGLHAGFASIDITPTVSLPMGGYVERSESSTGAHDPLSAKAVAFRHADSAALLIVLDVLYVTHAWARALRLRVSRDLQLPWENILIAATHTHSGPAVFSPLANRTESLAEYEDGLSDQCSQVARQAYSRLEPARMRVSHVPLEGIAANRRDSREQAGVFLSVVRMEDMRRRVRGHIVSVPCHPTVMGPSNLLFSADLFGACAQELEGKYKHSTCIVVNGASGDISTRFVRREQTWDEVQRLGRKLARQVVAGSRLSESAAGEPIRGKSVVMTFPFRAIPDVEEAQRQYEEAAKSLESLATSKKESRLVRTMLEGAAAQLFLSRLGGWEAVFGTDTAEVELQAIRIGDLIVSGLPGEFFVDAANRLLATARDAFSFVAGYANGYWGYVVPPEEARKGGYEIMMAPLDPSCEPEIILKAAGLIRAMSKTRQPRKSVQHV